MTTYLLDVNVLVALFDPIHVGHEAAHRWFAQKGRRGWATSPLTQNGFVRVVTNPAYPNPQPSTQGVVELLREFISSHKTHRFWADDVSIVDVTVFDCRYIGSHKQVSDAYLVGLCERHHGALATMDRKLHAKGVVGGSDKLIELIG